MLCSVVYLLLLLPALTGFTKVHQLFVPGTRVWDEQLVQSTFAPLEAVEILKLKPGASMTEDVLAWAPEKTGLFSVRSCYRLLKKEHDQKEAGEGDEAMSTEEKRWWKKLWKLKIPQKIRIFWWRAMNNFLASKEEMMRRYVGQENFCEGCGFKGESLYHIAFKCTFTLRFWQMARVLTGCKVPELHPATWTRDLLTSDYCSERDAAMVICGIWSLCSGRNARRPGKSSWSATAAAKHVAGMVEELLCLRLTDEAVPIRPRSVWKKPQHDWCKVNTDAAFRSGDSMGAGGVIIRDEAGRLLAAATKIYSHVPDTLTAEALAARDGLIFAAVNNVEKLSLETNQALVRLLHSDLGKHSPVAGLWKEIRELGMGFRCFKSSFVFREGNGAAHACAKLVSVSNREETWSHNFPQCLVRMTESDCNPHISV